ncbi:MAG TPA: hypothetical protein VFW94_04105 [Candidatus Acidoferrales bacterium]|nr:hypothetical protein [Candidatus Acidoferrales bacterium]
MARFVPPSKWRKLAKNAWKTDLGIGLLEIVIVEMSNEEYEKFRSSTRAAKKYINDHKFLKKPTRGVVFTKGAPSPTRGGEMGWIAVLAHTVDSMVYTIASRK